MRGDHGPTYRLSTARDLCRTQKLHVDVYRPGGSQVGVLPLDPVESAGILSGIGVLRQTSGPYFYGYNALNHLNGVCH